MKLNRIDPFGLLVEASSRSETLADLRLDFLRKSFEEHQLVILRNFAPILDVQEFIAFSEQFGKISLWPFGKVLELTERANPEDHIFDHHHVPLHWDGMYRPEVPEIQVFHCVEAPREDCGGRTTFTHTEHVLAKASQSVLEQWQKITVSYERKMEFYESKTIAPLITSHPVHQRRVLRYCEPVSDRDFVNHPRITFSGYEPSSIKMITDELRKALYAKEVHYAHRWQSGDLLLADNYTLLHGRERFVSGSPRHLRRIHVLGQHPLANPHLVSHR